MKGNFIMNSNSFWKRLESINNITNTANGDKSYRSSLSGLVDLMFKAGMKQDPTENPCNLIKIFTDAYKENPLYAVRLLFYIRDVRGGQGCKNFFRTVISYLGKTDPKLACSLCEYIPEYGSWNDLFDILKYNGYSNLDKTVVDTIFNMVKHQLKQDMKNMLEDKPISLLVKWMPSENTSSAESVKLAKIVRKYLEYDSKSYRKLLSTGRQYLDIVERKVCANEIDKIKYETVPSKAMLKYKHTFIEKDNVRFNKYLEAVSAGKSKINASTLYPCDLVHQIAPSGYVYMHSLSANAIKLFIEQWKALPDFFNGKQDNSIVVADVSGSMIGTPLEVCLSLACYIAERNKGAFHNKFITFSGKPQLCNLTGKNIVEYLYNMQSADWGMNTDLSKVFQLLFDAVTPETVKDMPSTIYIISDMQFDQCIDSRKLSTFEYWQEKFKSELGIELPKVVFWNVANEHDDVPVTIHNTGAILISGKSPAILKFVMGENHLDTLSLIKDIVYSPKYNNILSEDYFKKSA